MERLTKQEEDVMLQIWELKQCTVKQVLAQLDDPKPPYTTLASTVNNLKRKGYVQAAQAGITYIYSPTIEQSDYKRTFMKGFVSDYFKNSFREMVSFFAKEEQISPEELKDIIKEIEKGKETDI
ncbi:MAG: BlaI/MecI/CopY family transcriptional regulator [Prevotella sp.]|nr:BlaI/MecI/CopY family transcriptional regulator [Prevotella sp.]MDD7273439.1 BlaI/MecI/CopY family transcriptional regulator [Prevotellaceae bacterium]MDY3935889.1 BlaI/MecI/CopY family transcriptional regulator [Prevotella sp.]MDY4218197.1 BlaI/MecI/CopY family transcriptional regulator [Prevotella sp.]